MDRGACFDYGDGKLASQDGFCVETCPRPQVPELVSVLTLFGTGWGRRTIIEDDVIRPVQAFWVMGLWHRLEVWTLSSSEVAGGVLPLQKFSE